MSFFSRLRLAARPRHDLRATPPERAVIKLQGRVKPAGDRVLVAPLTGRECVSYRVTFELYAIGERTDLVIERVVPFLAVVGAKRARIDPAGMELLIGEDTLQVAQRNIGDDFVVPPLLEQMMVARGLPVRRGLELTGIFAREAALLAGEAVTVAGTVLHEIDDEPGRGQEEGTYREPPRRVALVAPGFVRALAPRPSDLRATDFRMPAIAAFD